MIEVPLDRPHRAAVIHKGRTTTCAELRGEVEELAAGLRGLGLSPGARAALLVPPGREFVALAFALFRAGLVPALIDPGIGPKSLGRCLEEAAPEVFIGSTKALAARAAFGWGRRSIKHLVRAGGLWPGAISLAGLRRLGGGEVESVSRDPAAILFTSGSTGPSKGVVYTNEMFSMQLDLLRALFDIKPGDISVPTFPLFGLFDVALGQTVVIPSMDATRPADVDPREIVDCVNRHGAAQLFGSPALLDTVGRWGEKTGATLPSLKRVLSAGAPVSWRILKRFKKLLPPECPIYTPYGATEALPVALISSDEVLSETAGGSAQGKGTCVGKPVPGVEVDVIRITDEPIPAWSDTLRLPDGEIGELVARGAVVSREYWKRPPETALAKIGDRHRMGDLGWRDERGRLWFCGRKSQRVRTAEGTLFTVACEGVFNAHPRVKRSALVSVRRTPVLCVELEPAARGQEDRVREELLALARQNERTKTIARVLFHPKFPVDIRHNAKIFREKLALWAERKVRP